MLRSRRRRRRYATLLSMRPRTCASNEHPADACADRPGRGQEPHRDAADDDAHGGRRGLRHRRQHRLLHGARERRHRPHHGRDGLAGKMRPPSPPRGRHLRRPLPAGADAARRRNPSRRRQGLDPARARRRPHPQGHLRRDADRAVGHPASGLRDHVRDHRSRRDDQGADRADDRRACRGRAYARSRPASTASRFTPRTAT